MKDELIQRRLAQVMLGGVLLAAAVIAAGWVWFVVGHPGLAPGDHLFTGEPKYLENPVLMVRRALETSALGHRQSVIMIGIALLLINPLVRVGLALGGFAAQKDRLYTAVCLVVLSVLLFSLFA
ncbi:MAG TPA: DUF1634 domain-containing protein [Verrucomicrobiota bacterium]|nr:DUF1634 domain-containing protein [Verrucomicrobiales bacterium]HRI14091.1 DUF1634 domain-containing protein [Verrucomicrobiota bacterium]